MQNEVLSALAQINVAAGAAIIAILILRKHVRRHIGPRAAYAIWLLVPAVAIGSQLPARHVFSILQTPLVSVGKISHSGGGSPETGIPASHTPALTPAPGASGTADAAPLPDLSEILIFLWIAGVVATCGHLIRTQRRFMKNLGEVRREELDGLRIIRADHAHVSPALMGIIRQFIILPSDFEERFNREEQRLILAHERAHMAAGDNLVNLLSAVAVCLGWFNPLIHIGARRLREDQEIACDANVVERFPENRRIYAEVLLKSQLLLQSAPLGCAWPSGPDHPLKERVAAIRSALLQRRQTRFGVAFIACLTMLGGAIAWGAQPPIRSVRINLDENNLAHAPDQSTGRPHGRTNLQESIYAVAGVDLEEIAAKLTVTAEKRNDIVVSIAAGHSLPKPQLRIERGRLVIDGGIPLRKNPCRKRFNGTSDLLLPGYGRVQPSQLPVIVVRTPLKFDLTVDGAVISTIHASKGGRVENHGCGDMHISATSGPLDVSEMGHGFVYTGRVNGALKASLYGTGSMNLGRAGDAEIQLIGTGNINTAGFSGSVKARLQGTGDMHLGDISNGAEFSLPGAGNLFAGNIVGSVGLMIRGDGKIEIASIDAPNTDIEIPGSGDVKINGGSTRRLTVKLSGSGDVTFNGHADHVYAEFERGGGNVKVASAGDVATRRKGRAEGEVIVGK